MATYFARKSGNINATDVWATTPSGTAAAVTFASGDVLVANSFTVTVNVSTDLGSTGEVHNDTTGGATAGGSFALSSGVTLTAKVIAGSAVCVTLSGTASATIVGSITGGSATNAHGVETGSSGTLTITGAVTGGSATQAYGVSHGGSTVAITGNVTGGLAQSAGLHMQYNGITVITGDVTASSGAFGVRNWGVGTITITGTVTGGSGTATNSSGAYNNGAGTINVVGTAVGGNQAPGVYNAATGTVSVTRAKGGPAASSSVGLAAASTAVSNVEEIEFGDNAGASPTSGPIRLTDNTSNVAVMYRFNTAKKNLVDANASGLMPSASDVRYGTVYNGGNSTGSCRVPGASSVASGVLVDATAGTAALTPAAVWDYLTSSATTSGSMGERLKNAATVASVGQALADAVAP